MAIDERVAYADSPAWAQTVGMRELVGAEVDTPSNRTSTGAGMVGGIGDYAEDNVTSIIHETVVGIGIIA